MGSPGTAVAQGNKPGRPPIWTRRQLIDYFGDKQGLVLAVVDFQTNAKLDQQRPWLDNLDSIDALRAWCDRAADRQDAMGWVGGCEIGSLAGELAETDPSARTDLAASFERWEAPIRSGLARMQAAVS